MNDNIMQQLAAIGVAVLSVAIVAVLVSQNANTANVINAMASGFSQILGTAISPVTSGGNANRGPFGTAGFPGLFGGG